MPTRRPRLTPLAALTGLAFAAAPAEAALIPSLVAIRTGTYADRPGTRYGEIWDQQRSQADAASAQIGDRFTIVDFWKFDAVPVGESTGLLAPPPGWSWSSQLTGGYPTGTGVADDPSVANITWTRTSSAVVPPGPVNFQHYVVPFFNHPTTPALSQTWPAAQRHLTPVVSVQGSTVTVGSTLVPTAAPVPEPATAGALAVAAVGGLLRRHRRRARA